MSYGQIQVTHVLQCTLYTHIAYILLNIDDGALKATDPVLPAAGIT